VLRVSSPRGAGEDRERPYREHTGWSHGWRVTERYTGCKLGEMQNHACRASSKNLISSYGKLWVNLPAFSTHGPSMESKLHDAK